MDIVERLRGVPLFSQVSDFHLLRLGEIAEERQVPADAVLTRQADLGATFFIVDSGEAVIHHVDEQGLKRPVGVLHAGDSFGVTSLFLGEPRDATVTALTEMRLWTIRRPVFENLLLDYPALRDELRIPEAIQHKLKAPRYPWLQPGEMVVFHCRRHWSTFAGKMLVATLMILGYAAVLVWLVLSGRVSLTWGTVSVAPAAVIYLGYLVWQWVDWQNDYFAVSTQRVTARERVALIYESRQEVPLEQVQNINVVKGPIGSVLGFGSLTITTAAAMGQMVFTDIPQPEDMRDAVFGQIARTRAIRQALHRDLIRQDLATHMNLQMPETIPEAPPGAEGPIGAADAGITTRQPWLVRLAGWLMAVGFIPPTRVEESGSITWRKHWIFLLRRVVVPLTVVLVCGVLTFLGLIGLPELLASVASFFPLVTLALTIVGAGWFWWEATDWSNDLYTLTSDRIIDIEKRPLFFSEQRREANLGVIQNVSLEIPNAVAALFDYGDVIVKTAGTGDFTFHDVGNPRDVQREVFARMSRYKVMLQERDEAQRRREMAEWFSVFDEVQRARDTSRSEPPSS